MRGATYVKDGERIGVDVEVGRKRAALGLRRPRAILARGPGSMQRTHASNTVPREARKRALRSTAWASSIACVAVVLAAAPSTGLLHWSTRTAGLRPQTPVLRAWVNQAGVADLGLRPGASISFSVALDRRSVVWWRELNRGHVIDSGRISALPGTTRRIAASTIRAAHESWAEVQIYGLRTPLRVWIR